MDLMTLGHDLLSFNCSFFERKYLLLGIPSKCNMLFKIMSFNRYSVFWEEIKNCQANLELF